MNSYGFRGEALASIASISRVTCETLTKKTHGVIKIDGAETLSHQVLENTTTKTGTKFFIKDLFFNTPVRMKFIQSKTSEKNQLKKIINAFLLTHPHIEFTIQWDDKDKEFYHVHTEDTLRKRIQDVLCKGKETNFVEAQNAYDAISFKVFLTTESSRGNAHKHFYLFINERYVQDIQIHKIILNSASAIWPEGETGNYVGFLTIPNDEIDVNIHPNKTVVKLFKAPKAFSVISSSIKHKIASIFKKIESPANEQVQTLPLETQTDSFKELDYKKVDFNRESDLTSYFENLHAQKQNTSQESELSQIQEDHIIVKDYAQLCLLSINNELYSVNKRKMILMQVLLKLKKDVSAENIVPLLVSKPIKINKKMNESLKESLQSLGFEVDQFDEQTIVLRTFPKALQQYPYIKFLEEIISQSKDEVLLDQIDFSKLDLGEIPAYQCIDIIKEAVFTSLIQRGLLKQLTEKDLLKHYAQK